MVKGVIIVLLFLQVAAFAGGEDGISESAEAKKHAFVEFLQEYVELRYDEKRFDSYLYVSIKSQMLYHISNGMVVAEYPVSTSKYGVGFAAGSKQTPDGLHSVQQKVGDRVPFGGVLKARLYTGEEAEIIKDRKSNGRDEVTTRILWLAGEEPGVNLGKGIDSYERCIYIHGTPEEGLVGEPASHGCIRMKNADVISLYEQIPEGTLVVILNN